MAEFDDEYRRSEGHALAVDFIENDLPKYHPYFNNPPVRYDKRAMHYVNIQSSEMSNMARFASTDLVAPVQVHDVTDLTTSKLNTKPDGGSHNAMTYWNMIFPKAMMRFRAMPVAQTIKAAPRYDIRNDKTWTEVYQKLEDALNDYTNSSKTKPGKYMARVKQWTADNAPEPVRLATSLVPQSTIVVPVLSAVKIIVDAIKKGVEVRREALEGFDELGDVFDDVELFLGTFQEEDAILEQAVNLVASVLFATENGIRFFTRHSWMRGMGTVWKGKDYGQTLLKSLTKITSQSKKLMDQALKNHIIDSKRCSQIMMQILHRINNNTESVTNGIQSVLGLLIDGHGKMVELTYQNKGLNSQETKFLGSSGRDNSLGQSSLMQPFPSHTFQSLPQPETPYVDQAKLWNLLSVSDIDTADMEEIKNKGKQLLPLQGRARTEQIVHNLMFQKWIVSPTSSKLMIYSNFSGLMMETSALSLFCTTLAEAFRSQKRYLCLVWFCGQHLGYDDESDSDLSGSESNLDDYLSLGHDEEDDYTAGTRQDVIKRMMRSLIAQLLCDYEFGPRHMLPPDVNPYVIEKGQSLSHLRRLFCWLVRQLPENVTLFCLVDGIFFYEREEFEDPMLDVLGDLLQLTVSHDVAVSVKVLVTSPRPTSTVRVGFEDNMGGAGTMSSILSMDLLTPSQVDVNEERLARNLGVIGDEDVRIGPGE